METTMSAKTEVDGLVAEIEMSKGQVVPLGKGNNPAERRGQEVAREGERVPDYVQEFIKDLFAVFLAGGNAGRDAEIRAARLYARHVSAFDADTLALALDVLCEYRKEAFRPTIAEVLKVC